MAHASCPSRGTRFTARADPSHCQLPVLIQVTASADPLIRTTASVTLMQRRRIVRASVSGDWRGALEEAARFMKSSQIRVTARFLSYDGGLDGAREHAR